MRLHRLHLTGIAVLFLALALAACGGSSPTATPVAAPNAFVGAVPGTDAFVALITTNGTSLSYVCDSKQVASWFKGPVTNNAIDATAANGDRLKATLSATGATGTLTMGGKDFPFAAAKASGDAGLFRAEQAAGGANVVGGWIVGADGQQRGAIHRAQDNRDEIVTTPPLVVAQKAPNNTWMVNHPTFGALTVNRVARNTAMTAIICGPISATCGASSSPIPSIRCISAANPASAMSSTAHRSSRIANLVLV